MRIELSALIDGETEDHETRAILATMKSNPDLRASWNEYHLIGDALRAEGRLSCDLVPEIMQSLADEPVVLAPVSRPASWFRPLAALAASVAGVAVVAWLAVPSQPLSSGANLAVAKVQATTVASAVPGRDLQEYLLAHQANAPGLRLQGDRQNIRTVSLMENGR